MEKHQPASHPTASDISQFMQWLGFEWSNEGQIYYETNNYEGHITRRGAENMYKKVIGALPFKKPLIIGQNINN